MLKRMLNSDSAEFLALYGRRRVGKTFLIRSYFSQQEDAVLFDVMGEYKADMSTQVANFTDRMGEVFYGGASLTQKKNWRETFKDLTKAMAGVSNDKKIILFFDEFPWMVTKNSGLLQCLDYFWNQYWATQKNIKLIICGSSASWIIEKIINNKAGLHNRVTQTLLLEPFNLQQSQTFLQKQGLKVSHQQVCDLYMVSGGVPHYLLQYKKGLSVAQNIEQAAFQKNAFFLGEFNNLFASLFEAPEVYIAIIRYLAKAKRGIAQDELLTSVPGLAQGGQSQKKLAALEEAGFITSFIPHFHRKKGIYYKVTDEYCLFYLRWIEPVKNSLLKQGLREHYWESEMQTSAWRVWAGYAFEAICYKHIAQIGQAINVSPAAIPSSWRYVPKQSKEEQGAEIDLLFDRKDNAISICEIKYTSQPLQITKELIENLNRKLNVFQKQTKTKKQLLLVLISANGVKNSYYADEIIDAVVTVKDLFG